MSMIIKKLFSAVCLILLATTLTNCSSSGDGPAPDENATLTLFVTAEFGIPQIYVFNNASTADGAVVPDQNIVLPMPSITTGCDIGYDGTKEIIYVATWGNGVMAFDNSASPTGNIAPNRTISGANTLFGQICGIEVDAKNDRLYVGGNQGISVYDAASTVDGNVTADRLVTGAATLLNGTGEVRLHLDRINNRLYVADSGVNQVLVFNNASTMDGNIAPNRVISGVNTTFNFPWGISVDVARDKLYIGNFLGAAILIFDNASTVDGNVVPNRIVSGANAGLGSGVPAIFIDENNDILYATTRTGGQIRIWNNASTMDGDTAPDRVITGLLNPNGIAGVYR